MAVTLDPSANSLSKSKSRLRLFPHLLWGKISVNHSKLSKGPRKILVFGRIKKLAPTKQRVIDI